MQLIYHTLTLLLLLLNIAGLSVFMQQWLKVFALARISGILLFCLALFFVEHFHGLGQLRFLWPCTTLLAAGILYKRWCDLDKAAFWAAERVFILAFGYALAWKWAFPVIYPTSERITDLYFIGNYLPGETLPPLDHWYPPHRFDFYYAFQHYAAALMGRILGLGAGLTYNLAFSLLMALGVSLAWQFISALVKSPWQRCLIILTFIGGGTGASPWVHLGHDMPAKASAQDMTNLVSDAMWASQRFIGSFDQRLNTDVGRKVFPALTKGQPEAQELPLEDFGYQYYVGDYHPPLAGFCLLMLALACMGELSKHPEQRQAWLMQALLAFSVPLTIASNTWVFPLQAALVGAWVLWVYCKRQALYWQALWTGAGVGFILLYPFLTAFTSNALPTPIKLVAAQCHTPLPQFLALHWPLLFFVLLSCFAKGARQLGLLLAAVFLGLLVLSETIFVDDLSGGKYERTNTVMKWWGWIWSGALVALASVLLSSHVRWLKALTIVALLVINCYILDVVRYWIYTDKSAAGKLAADSVYTYDPAVREMFKYLANAPDGIVLENNYGGSFTDSGVYSAFAVKPTLLGWPMHLLTWHASIDAAWALKEQIVQFYNGQLPDAGRWLVANQVKYIVWNRRDAQTAKAWAAIAQSISHDYNWQAYSQEQDQSIGLWIRR